MEHAAPRALRTISHALRIKRRSSVKKFRSTRASICGQNKDDVVIHHDDDLDPSARIDASRYCPVHSYRASARVRPAHKLHCAFDTPPVFGQFDLALLFETNGVLSGLHNCLGTARFQQLPRIVVDFDFSHGVTLLGRGVTATPNRAP